LFSVFLEFVSAFGVAVPEAGAVGPPRSPKAFFEFRHVSTALCPSTFVFRFFTRLYDLLFLTLLRRWPRGGPPIFFQVRVFLLCSLLFLTPPPAAARFGDRTDDVSILEPPFAVAQNVPPLAPKRVCFSNFVSFASTFWGGVPLRELFDVSAFSWLSGPHNAVFVLFQDP